jgi:hypothetical protein
VYTLSPNGILVGGHNPRPESLRMIEVPLDVFDTDILIDFIRARRPKLGSRSPYHEVAIATRELSVCDPTTGSLRPQPLGKPEGTTEPLNCLTHILID